MDPDRDLAQSNLMGQKVGQAQTDLPVQLENLRSNLSQIYNKDNPLIQQREGLLANYLSAGDRARNQLLPQNAGGTVFSPTELQAITSTNQAASLAPLASLNNLIMGQYGSLHNYLDVASRTAQARLAASGANADRLLNSAQIGYQRRDAERQYELQKQQLAQPNYQMQDFGTTKALLDMNTGDIIRSYNQTRFGGEGSGLLLGGQNNNTNVTTPWKPTVPKPTYSLQDRALIQAAPKNWRPPGF